MPSCVQPATLQPTRRHHGDETPNGRDEPRSYPTRIRASSPPAYERLMRSFVPSCSVTT